jgi:hypothetical protein
MANEINGAGGAGGATNTTLPTFTNQTYKTDAEEFKKEQADLRAFMTFTQSEVAQTTRIQNLVSMRQQTSQAEKQQVDDALRTVTS